MGDGAVPSLFIPPPLRPSRCTYDVAGNATLVVDNGAFCCRAGWAGEAAPRVQFRSLVSRPKAAVPGHYPGEYVVGEYDPTMVVKGLDLTRATEAVLDHAFDRLALSGNAVDHPVVITETIANLPSTRSNLVELMFEAYGVPSMVIGPAAAFSHVHARKRGQSGLDALLVSSGCSVSHVLPMIGGEPLLALAARVNVGGAHMTDLLQRLLLLQQPLAYASLGARMMAAAEALKVQHMYVAEDYTAELETFAAPRTEHGLSLAPDAAIAERVRRVQLPFNPQAEAAKVATAEDLARRAQLKADNIQRLRDMHVARKQQRAEELAAKLQMLEKTLEQATEPAMQPQQQQLVLAEAGYETLAEVRKELTRTAVAHKKARGDGEDDSEPAVEESPKEYPLLAVPDAELDPEQLKEKKRQRLMKNMEDGRARIRQQKLEMHTLAEAKRKAEEEEYLADPQGCIERMWVRHAALRESVHARRRAKAERTATDSGRRSVAQRERMRLVAEAADDNDTVRSGGGRKRRVHDTFGADDGDWAVYKKMDRHASDSEGEEEETELERMEERLRAVDPEAAERSLGPPSGAAPTAAGLPMQTAVDYQLSLTVQRVRVPEVLFQPTIIGIEQAGLNEVVAATLARVTEAQRQAMMRTGILLTGGCTNLSGFATRVELDVRMNRPTSESWKVTNIDDGALAAWCGAAGASLEALWSSPAAISRVEYEEHGRERLKAKPKLQFSSL